MKSSSPCCRCAPGSSSPPPRHTQVAGMNAGKAARASGTPRARAAAAAVRKRHLLRDLGVLRLVPAVAGAQPDHRALLVPGREREQVALLAFHVADAREHERERFERLARRARSVMGPASVTTTRGWSLTRSTQASAVAAMPTSDSVSVRVEPEAVRLHGADHGRARAARRGVRLGGRELPGASLRRPARAAACAQRAAADLARALPQPCRDALDARGDLLREPLGALGQRVRSRAAWRARESRSSRARGRRESSSVASSAASACRRASRANGSLRIFASHARSPSTVRPARRRAACRPSTSRPTRRRRATSPPWARARARTPRGPRRAAAEVLDERQFCARARGRPSSCSDDGRGEAFDPEVARVHAQDRGDAVVLVERLLVVAVRAVGRADLDERGAALLHDLRHAERAADLDQFAARRAPAVPRRAPRT